MQYELECGHCGYLFTLEEGALARSVKCPVCGGVLTIAVPVPVVAEKPPEPPPPSPSPIAPPAPAYEPLSFPILIPERPDLGYMEPELRARHLFPPWPHVYRALNTAHNATAFATPLFILFLVINLVVVPLAPATDRKVVVSVLWIIAAAHLLPVLIHIVAQVRCLETPDSHGGRQVMWSWWLMVMSWWCACELVVPDAVPIVAVVFTTLVVISFAVWLVFLDRLGQRLNDRPLMGAAWSYTSWFWVGLVVMLLAMGGAYLATKTGNATVGWFCRVAAGTAGLLLLRGYASVLRTACLAVARRAPVSSDG